MFRTARSNPEPVPMPTSIRFQATSSSAAPRLSKSKALGQGEGELAAQEQPESQKAVEDWEADAVANLLCGEEDGGCDTEAAAAYDMQAAAVSAGTLKAARNFHQLSLWQCCFFT